MPGTPSPRLPVRFLSRQAYFGEVIDRIHGMHSGQAITLMTMAFDPGVPQTRLLLEALRQALQRGVRVRLSVDANTFMVRDEDVRILRPGPLFWHTELPDRLNPYFRAKQQTLQQLRDCGGQVVITNLPDRALSSPFHSRSHIKLLVLDNSWYIGGVNLSGDTMDEMVTGTDAATAGWLNRTVDSVFTARSTTALHPDDHKRRLDDATDILLDAGVPGQSVIYNEALRLIDTSREWIDLTCQYIPNSLTAERLRAAYGRGVRIRIYYNHPAKHVWPTKLGHFGVRLFEHHQSPSSFFVHEQSRQSPYLHAKILATDQGGIIGSHNYIQAGVRFGTAELALVRRDADFARQLIDSFRQAYIS